MDVWKQYVGKKVFIILKNGRQYAGKIINVDDVGNGLVFISMNDIKGHLVTFTSGEIEMIQEER